MGISEKIAYLKGLMEGMNVDTESNEGKLFAAVVDVLDEIALEVEDLTDEVMELGDGLDVISDDLSDVEDIVYDEWDDDDDDDDDDDEDEEPAEETEASPEEVLQYAWETVCYVIWGKASAKGGQKVVETAPEELKERCRQIFIPITESLEERGGLL